MRHFILQYSNTDQKALGRRLSKDRISLAYSEHPVITAGPLLLGPTTSQKLSLGLTFAYQ